MMAHFNFVFLTCLGKTPSHVDGAQGNIFTVTNTRPISVGNCDNRLLTNAIRLRIASIIEPYISKIQRELLKGRFLLTNVVDIDQAAMTVSLKTENGCIVLFDFKAAFPSISREFLWKTFKGLGMPEPLIRALQCFYISNRHIINVKGQMFLSFTTFSGIKQGCPLSPLLFALAVDIFLKRLEREFPSATTRAFADDLAMVTDIFSVMVTD